VLDAIPDFSTTDKESQAIGGEGIDKFEHGISFQWRTTVSAIARHWAGRFLRRSSAMTAINGIKAVRFRMRNSHPLKLG